MNRSAVSTRRWGAVSTDFGTLMPPYFSRTVSSEFAAGVRHNHRVQVHVTSEAWIQDLHLGHVPAVKKELLRPFLFRLRSSCFCFYHTAYLRGFSLRPVTISRRLTLFTLVTTNRTPGISPFDLPSLPPMPSISTSSCSSMKLMAPSPTANAVNTHLLENDPAALRCSLKGVSFYIEPEQTPRVASVMPPVIICVALQFSGCKFSISHRIPSYQLNLWIGATPGVL
ncbi:MAG: hypothetical protein XD82_0807 [Methanoculleus marisnigri]|uniref:Uncharacterized protein n=1 Tax=Methanoculleus marisnigri TaxID=2198 RepID=A0A101GPC8_9EURY|nr:MAG: hypothetical protein XD82_0807 [Methanoculleus marisnigri]